MQALILLALVAASQAATTEYNNHDNNGNYNFGYSEDTSAGGTFRRERGDAYGNKAGAYGVHVAGDDRIRIVNYVADENGFRASIQTNEPGVHSNNPANVVINKAPESNNKAPEADIEKAPVTNAPVIRYDRAPVAIKKTYAPLTRFAAPPRGFKKAYAPVVSYAAPFAYSYPYAYGAAPAIAPIAYAAAPASVGLLGGYGGYYGRLGHHYIL